MRTGAGLVVFFFDDSTPGDASLAECFLAADARDMSLSSLGVARIKQKIQN